MDLFEILLVSLWEPWMYLTVVCSINTNDLTNVFAASSYHHLNKIKLARISYNPVDILLTRDRRKVHTKC